MPTWSTRVLVSAKAGKTCSVEATHVAVGYFLVLVCQEEQREASPSVFLYRPDNP